MSYPLTETSYGFNWGPARIERCVSDPKFGVVLMLQTDRQQVDIRITPSGLIRVEKIVKAPKRPIAQPPQERP